MGAGAALKRRPPLPRWFNAALTEDAYARLRVLNAQQGLGNKYLLTVLLERLDDIACGKALERAFADFKVAYGAPPPAGPRIGG